MPPGRFIPFELATGATYALGLTYAEHIRETGETPGQPVVFLKRCAATPSDQARIPPPPAQVLRDLLHGLDPEMAAVLTRQGSPIPALLDYEVEIGVVLFGEVSEAALVAGAPLPPLGFFLANDLTVRSIQIAGEGAANRLDFWSAAKSLPGFLPVGSRIWCPDGPGPETLPELVLETWVNGVLRQSASTQTVIYTLRQMLRCAAAAAPDRQLLGSRNEWIATACNSSIR